MLLVKKTDECHVAGTLFVGSKYAHKVNFDYIEVITQDFRQFNGIKWFQENYFSDFGISGYR